MVSKLPIMCKQALIWTWAINPREGTQLNGLTLPTRKTRCAEAATCSYVANKLRLSYIDLTSYCAYRSRQRINTFELC